MSYKCATPLKLIKVLLPGTKKRNADDTDRGGLSQIQTVLISPDPRHPRFYSSYWVTTSTHLPLTPDVMLLSYMASQ